MRDGFGRTQLTLPRHFAPDDADHGDALGDTDHENALGDTNHRDALGDPIVRAGLKGVARSRAAGPWSPLRASIRGAGGAESAPNIPQSDRERAGAFGASFSPVVADVRLRPTTGSERAGAFGASFSVVSSRSSTTPKRQVEESP